MAKPLHIPQQEAPAAASGNIPVQGPQDSTQLVRHVDVDTLPTAGQSGIGGLGFEADRDMGELPAGVAVKIALNAIRREASQRLHGLKNVSLPTRQDLHAAGHAITNGPDLFTPDAIATPPKPREHRSFSERAGERVDRLASAWQGRSNDPEGKPGKISFDLFSRTPRTPDPTNPQSIKKHMHTVFSKASKASRAVADKVGTKAKDGVRKFDPEKLQQWGKSAGQTVLQSFGVYPPAESRAASRPVPDRQPKQLRKRVDDVYTKAKVVVGDVLYSRRSRWIPAVVLGATAIGLAALGTESGSHHGVDPSLTAAPMPDAAPDISPSFNFEPHHLPTVHGDTLPTLDNSHIPLSPEYAAPDVNTTTFPNVVDISPDPSGPPAFGHEGLESPHPGHVTTPEVPQPEQITLHKGDTIWGAAKDNLGFDGMRDSSLSHEQMARLVEEKNRILHLNFPGMNLEDAEDAAKSLSSGHKILV